MRRWRGQAAHARWRTGANADAEVTDPAPTLGGVGLNIGRAACGGEPPVFTAAGCAAAGALTEAVGTAADSAGDAVGGVAG